MSFFSKKSDIDHSNDLVVVKSDNVVEDTRNWYQDRFSIMMLQRNALLLLISVMVIIVLISVVVVYIVSSSKQIQPFIVQIESDTGITTVVNPEFETTITTEASIQKYFIILYIRAREAYNPATYTYYYNKVIPLMSSPDVYNRFNASIYNKNSSPIQIYGKIVEVDMDLRSVVFLDPGKTVQVRITLKPISLTGGSVGEGPKNRIVTMSYQFIPMKLNDEQILINPLGFQVTSYRIDDEL